jgi:hypothetical protein
MAASKAQYDVEESYNVVIQSESVQQPANIGMIFIYAKISLAPKHAATFQKELYDCIAQVAARYAEGETRRAIHSVILGATLAWPRT